MLQQSRSSWRDDDWHGRVTMLPMMARLIVSIASSIHGAYEFEMAVKIRLRN
jgi:hypothetical protein